MARDETSGVLAKVAGVARSKGGTGLLQWKLLALVGCGRKLALEVAHDLILKSRLAIEEALDKLGKREFTKLLFRPLRDDYCKDIDGANRGILNTSSQTGSSGGNKGRSDYGRRSCD
jgi:hypothetical protein